MPNRQFSIRLAGIAGVLLTLLCFSPVAQADPCGMVPPIYTGPGSPITRTGLQQTYVFYKDGIETFVIRPGFEGKIDNFGMLIPFPNPPALRKVPDNLFEQIANAVDPPEVVIDVRFGDDVFAMESADAMLPAAAAQMEFQAESVVVVKQEAVGMYEVAVLQAGSAEALKRWMDQNGFIYPEGMDKVTEDYVQQGWCFVAVKTKVGNKGAIEPAPGQRHVDPTLPQGSVFDGHVQGMGFRFKSDELVVPMRLSAFNGGDMRNIVYLLTDGPRKARSIPEQFVVRQVKGSTLIKNVTQPLPLRIIGGTEKDIPDYRRKSLPEERDPAPYNAMAKELFASDLLAVETGNLSLEHEETEKELLRIGEHFGLRGPEVDRKNAEALQAKRDQTVKRGIDRLADMTLTVVDGDFPRQVIAEKNVTFENYLMPAAKNSTEFYQAPLFGPGGKKEGVLKTSFIDWPGIQKNVRREHVISRFVAALLLGVGLAVALAWSFFSKPGKTLPLILVATCSLATTAWAHPAPRLPACQDQSTDAPQGEMTLPEILEKLKDSKTAPTGIEQAVVFAKQGDAARQQMIQALVKLTDGGDEIAQKGWAIAALAKIGGQDVDEQLLDIHSNRDNPAIVRTWAAAARVSMTQSINGLIEKANLIREFPSLGRPIGLRLVEKMNDGEKSVDLAKVIGVTVEVPELAAGLAPAIMAFGPEAVAEVAMHGPDNRIRRTAAGYLGAFANQGQSQAVAELVTSELKFNPDAKVVPWQGGALFLPGIQWSKPEAQRLVGQLLRWYVWCDTQRDAESQRQLYNNLRSIQLAGAAGYQVAPAGNVTAWLESWGKVVGKEKIQQLLKEQGLLDNRKYSLVLNELGDDN